MKTFIIVIITLAISNVVIAQECKQLDDLYSELVETQQKAFDLNEEYDNTRFFAKGKVKRTVEKCIAKGKIANTKIERSYMTCLRNNNFMLNCVALSEIETKRAEERLEKCLAPFYKAAKEYSDGVKTRFIANAGALVDKIEKLEAEIIDIYNKNPEQCKTHPAYDKVVKQK